MAVSWGRHERLVIPKCAGIKPSDPIAIGFDSKNPAHRYVRLYVGLEEPGYLIKDLSQALANLR